MHLWIILLIVLGAAVVVLRKRREWQTQHYFGEIDRVLASASSWFAGLDPSAVRVFHRGVGLKRLAWAGGLAGVVARSGDHLRLVFIDSDGNSRRFELPVTSTTPSLMAPDQLSLGLPTLLRLDDGKREVHFAAVDDEGECDGETTHALAIKLFPQARSLREQRSSAAVAAIRALLALPFLVAVGGLVYFSSQRADSGAYAVAAAANGEIALASEQRLYVVGPEGELRQFGLRDFGIRGPVTHMAYSAQGELHLADSASGSIFSCTYGVGVCMPLPEHDAVDGPFGEAFRFTFTPDGRFIVVTDTYTHALVVVDRDGDILAEYEVDETGLCLPNGIAYGRDGRLYVADSNHLRIVSFDLGANGLRERGSHATASQAAGECISHTDKLSDVMERVSSLPGMRDDRARPVALAQDGGGHWWVTLSNVRSEPADVAMFSEDWKRVQRVAGPEDLDSFALAAFNGGVLVADAGRHGLLRAGADTLEARSYDNAAFAEAMAQVASAGTRTQLLRLAMVGVMALVLGVFLVISARRTTERLAQLPIPAAD